MTDHLWTVWAWALDFTRAVVDLPAWRRSVVRVAVGRKAYCELFGLARELERRGSSIDLGLGLGTRILGKKRAPRNLLDAKLAKYWPEHWGRGKEGSTSA